VEPPLTIWKAKRLPRARIPECASKAHEKMNLLAIEGGKALRTARRIQQKTGLMTGFRNIEVKLLQKRSTGLHTLMSVISLFFSCATLLWCIRWESLSFRILSHDSRVFLRQKKGAFDFLVLGIVAGNACVNRSRRFKDFRIVLRQKKKFPTFQNLVS
jgi:hypothetical protein